MVAVVSAVVALPFFLDLRSTNLAAAVLIYSITAISLVLLTGWAGEISLGQMLNGFREVFYAHPERIFYPGFTLVVIVLCASFLGDGLRDALDPRQRVES